MNRTVSVDDPRYLQQVATGKELRRMHQVGRNHISQLPQTCANCGSNEEVEYHHIVPLYVGGTNRKTNIVPLCASCHYAVHHGVNLDDFHKRIKVGGRPQKTYTKAQIGLLEQYLLSEVPKSTVCDAFGIGNIDRKSRITKESMKSLGICNYQNKIESLLCFHGIIRKGEVCGYIERPGAKKRIPIYAKHDYLAEDYNISAREGMTWQTR